MLELKEKKSEEQGTLKVELLAITPAPELLLEIAGRTCYLSFDKVTNESYKKFIRMVVKNGHHSVLEHASATFRIKGGSRAFTHQLVRHRVCSFSQQSQRYVEEGDFSFVIPDSINQNPKAKWMFENCIKNIEQIYTQLKNLGIKKEDARFVLPNACQSEIVLTANFREFRHIFKERCSKRAQWEIRRIAMGMLQIMKNQAPIVFEDFIIDSETQSAEIKK